MNDVLAYIDQHHDLVTAAMAVLAVIVSFISVILTTWTLYIQRLHDRKSVQPIGHISVGDYENDIFVKIRNDGIGPMIISRVSVKHSKGAAKNALIHFMPDDISWNTFVDDVTGRAISPAGHITLLQLQEGLNDAAFIVSKRKVRQALSELVIECEYTNIYGEKMPLATRKLSWFGRLL
jgi:hypothetical protein